jgi:hypothetical protein
MPVGSVILDHLTPLAAFEFGHRLAGRHQLGEVAEGSFQDLGMAPERPVRGVPPVHLHVELAVPGVDAEAGLLRRPGCRRRAPP